MHAATHVIKLPKKYTNAYNFACMMQGRINTGMPFLTK